MLDKIVKENLSQEAIIEKSEEVSHADVPGRKMSSAKVPKKV